MCTLQTGKPCYNTSNYYRSSLCLYKCRTARELNFSSVTPISRNVSCRRVYGITKGYKGNTHKDTKIMQKICWSSQFMTKILSEENVFQISAVPTGVYVRIWTLPSHVKVLWFVSFPRCTAGPNVNGSSCIRLHTQCTTANTEATTPNVVGPTMLGVLAPVCSNL